MKILMDMLNGRDDRGATAVEYGLMLALIAAVIIGAAATLGEGVRDWFVSAIW